MTAKEKVLAVHSDAVCKFSVCNWGVYSMKAKEVIGIGNSEESAWQNAAESLPAQPEQVNLCAHGYDVGCFVCNSNPVAPVEATHNPPTEELFDRIAQRKQALVDSSSISSEQTFEEWWGNTGNQIFGADAKDAAFAAWNAAKGQSNGRS